MIQAKPMIHLIDQNWYLFSPYSPVELFIKYLQRLESDYNSPDYDGNLVENVGL